MGTWVEFRCENSANPSAQGGEWTNYVKQRCWSIDNGGPMGMAFDNRASLLDLLRNIEKDARKSGWRKTKYGWICPYCAGQPNVIFELEAENSLVTFE